jgi:phospholipid transport system substrate-binding protein
MVLLVQKRSNGVKVIRYGLLCLLFMVSGLQASDHSAYVMVKAASARFVKALQKRSGDWQGREGEMERLVKRYILPHVSVPQMSKMVVGRHYWISASNRQQRRFMREFQTMVIRSYLSVFVRYDGQKVVVYPPRIDEQAQHAQVTSVVVQPSGKRVALVYHCRRVEGRWKVVDLDIEGVSLVQNYRVQFADALSVGGLELLNARLVKHNRGN